MKLVEHKISYKRINGHTCLSLQGVELGGWKDCHVLNIIMYNPSHECNEQTDS